MNKKFLPTSRVSVLGVDPTFPDRYMQFHKKYFDGKNALQEEEGLRLLKKDIVLFVEMCIRVSSRGKGGRKKTMLFECWDAQKSLLRTLYEAYLDPTTRGVVCEKSRQQGASWLCCAFALFIAFFYTQEEIGFTSRKSDWVHKLNNVNTLLGKIEFMIENLPKALKKRLFHLRINKMCIDINSSTILGLTGEEGARSATPDMIINDEFAFNENAGALLTSAVPACPMNVFVSTLNTPDDEFDLLRTSSMYVQTHLDWHDDPRITDYEKFKKDTIAAFNGDEARFDLEFDRQYDLTSHDYLFPAEWLKPELHTESLGPHYQQGAIIAGFDVAGMGSNSNVLVIRQGAHIIDMYTWRKYTAYESVERLIEHCTDHQVDYCCFDQLGVGYGIASEFSRLTRHAPLPFMVIGVAFSWGADKQYLGNTTDIVLQEEEKRLFRNMRAKLYWRLREKVRQTVEQGKGVAVTNAITLRYPVFLKQMRRIKYSKEGGRITIHSKEKMKKEAQSKGMRWESPDELDALVLTFAMDDMISYQKICYELYR